MSNVINIVNASKTYKIVKKEQGLKGSFKSMISRQYEEKKAVENVSFSIDEGEFVGFIGPNGAGKTTTIKMLSGIIYPTSGEISVLGYTPQKLQNDFKRQISVTMGQKNQLWWDIPAQDSFRLIKVIYNLSDNEFNKTVNELTEILDVKRLLDVPLRNLSLGERMKMEIIGSILHNPKILFLDEPTIGLDVTSRRKIREFLQYINNERKTTIMLTSHYLEDIELLCNRIIAINRGKVLYDGDIHRMKADSLDKKYVSVSAYDKESLELIKKYSNNIEETGNTIKMLVDKGDLQNIGKEVFLNEQFYDVNIEEMPLDEIFEILFNKKELV